MQQIPTNSLGRSVLDFIHPDSLPVVRERIRQVGAGETAPLIEEKFVSLNGEVWDVEVTAIPIIYERAPASQVIIRDITERKQGEALLAGEKRLLEMIATGVELKEILNALCLIIEEQRKRHARVGSVAKSRWHSSGCRCRTESSQRMDAANGKAANWPVCWLLRHRCVSGITGHCLRHLD